MRQLFGLLIFSLVTILTFTASGAARASAASATRTPDATSASATPTPKGQRTSTKNSAQVQARSAVQSLTTNGVWPMAGNGPQRTNRSPYVGTQSNAQAWGFSVGSGATALGMTAGPVIGPDGQIYVGSNDHNVYAVCPNGQLHWTFPTGYNVNSAPAVDASGTVYVGSNDRNFYAINPNGTLKWKYTGTGMFTSSPAIGLDPVTGHNVIYVGDDRGILHAFDENGTELWSYTTGGIIYSSPAVDANGVVYVGSQDGNLYALKSPTSSSSTILQWKYTVGGPISSVPAVGPNQLIYFGSDDGSIYAVQPNATQTQVNLIWKYQTGNKVRTSAAISADGSTVYVGSEDSYLYALSATTGTLSWRYQPNFEWGPGGGIDTQPVVDANQDVYFADGIYLVAVDKNGSPIWHSAMLDMNGMSPAIGTDGTVYMGRGDSVTPQLIAFGPANTSTGCGTTPTATSTATSTATPTSTMTPTSTTTLTPTATPTVTATPACSIGDIPTALPSPTRNYGPHYSPFDTSGDGVLCPPSTAKLTFGPSTSPSALTPIATNGVSTIQSFNSPVNTAVAENLATFDSVGEPSAALDSSGQTVLYVGNGYDFASTDGGKTFRPSAAISGNQNVAAGIHDQHVLYLPGGSPDQDIYVWTGLGDPDKPFLAVTNGTNLSQGIWRVWPIWSNLAGVSGRLIDYPQLAATNGHVFLSFNTKRDDDCHWSWTVLRFSRADLQEAASGRDVNANYQYWVSSPAFSLVPICEEWVKTGSFVSGASNTMYWAQHEPPFWPTNDVSMLIIHGWSDSERYTSRYWIPVSHQGFAWRRPYSCPVPITSSANSGGTHDICRSDNTRVMSGWLTTNWVGFNWDVPAQGGPGDNRYPFVQVVWIPRDLLNAPPTIRKVNGFENIIQNPDHAISYAYAAAGAGDDVGYVYTVMGGQGSTGNSWTPRLFVGVLHPGPQNGVGLRNNREVIAGNSGGPAKSIQWGDFYTVLRTRIGWLVSAYVLNEPCVDQHACPGVTPVLFSFTP